MVPMMHANLLSLAAVVSIVPAPGFAQIDGATPVPLTDVRISDRFWARLLDTNRRVTVPFGLRKVAQTGRLSNFE